MTRTELLKTAKPILFNAEMVRAILDGRKTVTRRVIKPQPIFNKPFWELGGAAWSDNIDTIIPVPGHSLYNRMPFKPNDILYVRETWFYESHMEDMTAGEPDLPSGCYSTRYVYKASNPDYPVDVGVGANGWRPSIHMPKEAARIFLRVKDVRVEQLQNIITGDYRTPLNINREGLLDLCLKCPNYSGNCKDFIQNDSSRFINGFIDLWNSTVKKSDLDRYGWAANPWVWVIEFEKLEVDYDT